MLMHRDSFMQQWFSDSNADVRRYRPLNLNANDFRLDTTIDGVVWKFRGDWWVDDIYVHISGDVYVDGTHEGTFDVTRQSNCVEWRCCSCQSGCFGIRGFHEDAVGVGVTGKESTRYDVADFCSAHNDALDEASADIDEADDNREDNEGAQEPATTITQTFVDPDSKLDTLTPEWDKLLGVLNVEPDGR